MSIQIENLKLQDHKTILAKFDIVIPAWGLTIRECSYVKTDKATFITMPSRQYEKDGKKNYYQFVLWSEEKRHGLHKAVIPIVEEAIGQARHNHLY